ncbi:MAG: hypothetical protein CAF43_013720 [Nitrospira sp. CG24C]|nr:MAG: hypothetical protein CAF43_013720 [Nitrospira sp. CG24C]
MRFLFITTAIAIVTLVGCATQVERPRAPLSIERPCCQSVERAPSRNAIVKTAAKLVGAKTIESNGRRIAYDCAGVTRAVFLRHGIDLYGNSENDPEANGVRHIYAHIQQQGTFHQGPVAHPGDLIFFNDTWDYNGDGKVNDPLTHVGIVERQESDGTVVFISRVAGAVERYHMNLGLPHVHRAANGRLLNDYIRRKETGDPADTGYLTGELFAIFGTRIGL